MRTLLLATFVMAGFLPQQAGLPAVLSSEALAKEEASAQAGLPAVASAQAGEPINTMCPVKPRQKARATITGTYEGQVIGFC